MCWFRVQMIYNCQFNCDQLLFTMSSNVIYYMQ